MMWRLVAVLVLLNMSAFAQNNEPCGTDQLVKNILQNNPMAAQQLEEGWNKIHQYLNSESSDARNTVITIPVVFHVIHSGQPEGTGINIATNQLLSQLDVLNECYRKRNADTSLIPNWFKGREADIEIEFCLATTDPQGNPTSGITRDYYPNTTNFDVNVKPFTQWDPTKYLNIWSTVLASPLLGYATPPFFGPANQDGVVLDYRQIGKNPANPFGSGKMGKTCVHEVGHWLGLFHTFQDSCSGMSLQTCNMEGDRVCDTPPAAEATYGSSPNLVQNTCHESPVDEYDMWMNYMDYVNDNWLLMFTHGQKEIMRAVLNTLRVSIQSSLGCTNTAVTFSYSGSVVDEATSQPIANAKVLFDGPQDFEAVTDANGNFTINNMYEGYYDVYTGKWGYMEKLFMSHEYFIALSPAVTIPLKNHHYYDDFLFNYNWSVNSTSTGGFWTRDIPKGTYYQGVAANVDQDVADDFGLKCFMTGNGGSPADLDDVDNGTTSLISPAFDLSGYTDPYVRYYRWFSDLPLAGNAPDDVMSFKLNNGSSTVTLETITATENQWKQKTFRISDYITPTNSMRLIIDISDLSSGNANIVEGAIDKFEVLEGAMLDVKDLSAFENVTVFPNPTNGILNINRKGITGNKTIAEILNVMGQIVYTASLTEDAITINLSSQPAGLYFLRLKQGNSEKVLKISVNR